MKEVAIIAGASGGIGYEIALLLAQKKIDILIVAKSKRK
jgi:short-subunit dehydrogenase